MKKSRLLIEAHWLDHLHNISPLALPSHGATLNTACVRRPWSWHHRSGLRWQLRLNQPALPVRLLLAGGRKQRRHLNWENDPIVHAKLLWQPCKLVQMMMAPSSMLLLPYWSKIRKLKGSFPFLGSDVLLSKSRRTSYLHTLRWLSSGTITTCDFVLVAVVANVFFFLTMFCCMCRYTFVARLLDTYLHALNTKPNYVFV